MMFSKTCEYAIRATIYITEQSNLGRRVSLKDISKEIDSPEAFTAKILQQLSKNNIIDSAKGPTGGFTIEKEKMSQIKLNEIVCAIDGDNVYRGCGLGLKACSEVRPCPLHDKFTLIRDELKLMLKNTSLLELSLGLTNGITFLKR